MNIFRYALIRYEDLIDDPLTSLRKIFLNLNLKFDKRYLNAFYSHTQTSEMGDKDVEDFYFSVFRSKSFKHDHWKDEMNAEVIDWISSLFLFFVVVIIINCCCWLNYFVLPFQDIIQVEESCQDLMLKLKYNLTLNKI